MPAPVSRRATRRRTISEINMVPFIDVMLVLLIIFMVTAPLIKTGRIDLPSTGHAQPDEAQALRVSVHADGSLALHTEQGASPALSAQQVAAAAAQRPVLIAADSQTPYGVVVQAVDALHHAGVARVALSVRSKR